MAETLPPDPSAAGQPGGEDTFPSAGSYGRVARNTVLSLVAIGLLGASRLLFNVVVGRRFGAVTLGKANVAINTGLFASLLVSGGLQAASAKYLAQAVGRGVPGEAAWIYRRAMRVNLAGGSLVALGLVAVLPAALPHFALRGWDLVLAALVMFAYNGYQQAKGSYYGFGKVTSYLRNEIASDAVLLVSLGAVALASAHSLVLVPLVLAYGTFAIVASLELHRDALDPGPPSPALQREIAGFTALAVIGTVASTGFLNLSVTFAGRYRPSISTLEAAAQTGYYAAALALVLPIYFFPRALSLALFPSVAFRFGQQRIDTVARQLDLTTHALAVFLLPPTAALALAARPVLRLVYGPGYDQAADVLAILLAATYLSVVPIPSVTSLSGTERRWFKVPAYSSVLGLAIGLGLWIILGPRYSIVGIAWGYLIGSFPQSAIPMAFASRVFGVRFGWLALKAAAVWGAVLGIAMTMEPTEAGAGPGRIAAAIAITAIVYLILFARDLRAAVADARERISRRRALTG